MWNKYGCRMSDSSFLWKSQYVNVEGEKFGNEIWSWKANAPCSSADQPFYQIWNWRILYSEIDLPQAPLPSNAMVATRRGDEDPERVFRVGGPAVTAKFLRELRSASAPRKRISPPNDTRDEVETTTDGSPPSSLVNNCCSLCLICTCWPFR
jgi:hypothetical protein